MEGAIRLRPSFRLRPAGILRPPRLSKALEVRTSLAKFHAASACPFSPFCSLAFTAPAGAISRNVPMNCSISGCCADRHAHVIGIEANRLPTKMPRSLNRSTIGFTSEPISIIKKFPCEGMKRRWSFASSAFVHLRV